MCLAVIARHAHPGLSLIIVANRDEYHERPAEPARLWSDHPQVLAGRDLRAGGTWLGVSASGKVALLTNVREPGNQNPSAPSRGALVSHYLQDSTTALQYAQSIDAQGHRFNGFNLLLADSKSVHYASNRARYPESLVTQGVHGLSNATLDIAWPKVTRTTAAVTKLLAQATEPEMDSLTEGLFGIFRDAQPAHPSELPQTGLSPERELQLSSPFILDRTYGTRCSTVILADHANQIYFEERSFDLNGEITHRIRYQLDGVTQTFISLA
jgi:uncharacterized protein with NRDE domain